MAAPVIIVGSHVWVEDPHLAWIDGQVTRIDGQNIHVRTNKGKTVVTSVYFPKDTEASPGGVDDMTKLSYLHEPGVLQNLETRYELNHIYTYTGNILIAVNPFQRLPHLYATDMMEQYKGIGLGELSPHVFAIGDAAYRAMINEGKSNSILVSGESGAGKTETTKMLMRYLAFLGGRSGVEGRTVEQQVLESNPVLEAFGNAKTLRNNNSSRFGKFVEIQFDNHGRISGAAIRTYLLERSRVCQISDPERNYHCFYLLCAAPPEDIKKYKLGNPQSFHYLNQSSCYELDGVDDASEYLETRRAMDVVGISNEEQEAIFRVVAAILHLGNIDFGLGEEIDSSVIKDENSRFHLNLAAELLMCNAKSLEDALIRRVMVTPEEIITKTLDPDNAIASRDTLAKTIYSHLFDWIVNKINTSIGQDPRSKSIIGVLDIYGFESFKCNSFEQFCINFTNEKLQQHFNQHVFKMEQEEYTKEEIDWSYIEFIDNQDVLDLIEKKPGGIISLLDEACMFPKSTHETFSNKLFQTFKGHERFSKPKLSQTDFTISHYAGEVTYQSNHFIDKNKDYIVAEHQALFTASNCSFVAGLFHALHEDSSRSSKFSSIGSRFKAAPVIIVGSHVWVEDPHLAWIDGQVTRIDGQTIHVKTKSGKTVVTSVYFPKDTEVSPGGVDDMTKLSYLHEPGVLQNLETRYELNHIYTYTGNILIAVNPFQRLPHLYATDMMEQYKGIGLGELSPHVFAIGDAAYRAMINEGKSNSILVSGESGAGKTETTKMLMRYLAFLGGRSGVEGRTVEQQVLESNPVLEAFGNAKTLRNNNSSRFGKFVEIQFDKHGRISGAAIRTYLLERSRVCQISDPERNYHCFYLLCAAPPEDIKKYKLGNPQSFHYLNQSSCYELDGVDDASEYLETRRAMDVVGISNEEQEAIFRVVAAILHLGNIDFGLGEEIDSSVIKDEQSRFHLNLAAELLMCNAQSLEDALIRRVMVTPEEIITRTLDPDNAIASRDTLAKTIYSHLFDWIVNKINTSIGQDPRSKSIIGVLDIYGFESFKCNSFEQFCINFTNEKLQQHFNQHVFKMEQEEYTKEEIDWSYIEFIDNQDVLDLIEKKPGGIISLLDEACMFPKSTHETFSNKLFQTFKSHERFSKPKLSQTDFTISHYAGEVTYQSNHFIDKNKDYIVAEHQALFTASNCSFVASLFHALHEDSSRSSKFSSIGSRFKQQLHSLMETLNGTEPHYIRCIKPNNILKPGIFENFNVIHQLRCGGVLEAIRISCAGYPTRLAFYDFLERFGLLAPEVLDGNYDDEVACQMILDKKGLRDYQVGKTKIFLRAGQMAELDARRAEVLGNAARVIQRQFRTWIARKKFRSIRNAAIVLQSFLRGEIARIVHKKLIIEAAALKFQKNFRRYIARKSFVTNRSAAIVLQTGFKGMIARNGFRLRRQTKAAIVIQAHWRGHRAYAYYTELKKAAIVTQCAWRCRLARRELRMLKLQLTAYLEKIYGVIRDRMKREMAPLLAVCIQAPRQPRSGLIKGRSHNNIEAQKALIAHWQSIVTCLNGHLRTMRANYVPSLLIAKVFGQIFSFINVQLFNSLVLRRECCSFSNGEYVKTGLAELEKWCHDATEEFAGSAWDELKHIRQAVGFLVIHQKPKKSLHEITAELCPVLTVQQLYRISTMYSDDKYGTHSVSSEASNGQHEADGFEDTNKSFLLDDDSSIPFSLEDISKSMPNVEVAEIDPPPLIRQNTSFMFLLERNQTRFSYSGQVIEETEVNHVYEAGFLTAFLSLEDISKSMPNVEVAEIDPPPLIRQNTSFMFLLERNQTRFSYSGQVIEETEVNHVYEAGFLTGIGKEEWEATLLKLNAKQGKDTVEASQRWKPTHEFEESPVSYYLSSLFSFLNDK
ncbi:hypothetical protein Bca52824_078843 [Brassica carinata]|uniref:Uncharacterized protein n=1 Tax=Brassica carinata TaxID=52824 RepID=A0A8X7PW92_BRACI|nr:hypothetical protein Bca52824_078843 [Brassica carinata]